MISNLGVRRTSCLLLHGRWLMQRLGAAASARLVSKACRRGAERGASRPGPPDTQHIVEAGQGGPAVPGCLHGLGWDHLAVDIPRVERFAPH